MEERIQKAYDLLKAATKGVSITYHYTSGRKIGSLTIVGKKIKFNDTDAFLDAIDLANNFEVYPKTDGTVQMNLAFFDNRTEE